MLAEERFALILDLLARQRMATVQELCEALSASESTIRRDLNELDKMGRLNKVHGGATLPDSPFRTDEPTMAAKEELAVDQKHSIARAAAALIKPEDFIFLDAGSTTLAVARALTGPALHACYVTNGVAHARLLAQKGCRVFLPGGASYPAVTNVGTRPTVNNGTDITVEAWLLDFDGDLYGQTVRVEFYHHIRDEIRFDSLDALKAEITRNAETTRQYFASL